MPYQVGWITDDRRFKLWDKSRRIGATYGESYRAVRRRNMINHKRDYWFSSADESAAAEFALYCRQWCELIEAVAEHFTETLEDDEGYKYNNYVVQFPNGSRINCMSSNPRRFRSKGGDVCLDEFDWHDDPGGMLDAATPVTTWGYDISILTTRNGEGSEFDRLVGTAKKIQAGELDPAKDPVLDWSYHHTPITVAVDQGLAEKIYKLDHVDHEARKRFLAECRAKCRNEDTFMQEYMCVPSASASTLISYDMYQACEDPNCLQDLVDHTVERKQYFVGVDVGREKHLTVLWVWELVGDVLVARKVIRLKKTPYEVQLKVGDDLLANRNVVRLCGDATGLGDMLIEMWQKRHGEYRVEKVKFTATVKDHLASLMLGRFQDRRMRVPDDLKTRESFHAVKKTVSISGNVRYDAAQTDDGHADEFWAAGLGCEAAWQPNAEPECILL